MMDMQVIGAIVVVVLALLILGLKKKQDKDNGKKWLLVLVIADVIPVMVNLGLEVIKRIHLNRFWRTIFSEWVKSLTIFPVGITILHIMYVICNMGSFGTFHIIYISLG